MADNLTTTTEVDPAVATFYDRVLLKRGLPKLVHALFADKKPLGSKKGNTIKFRRYSALTTATTPITEGVTPPGQKLAKIDLTAQVSQYGDYVHITDWVDLTVEDPVLTVANEELGLQMGQTHDEIIRDIMTACASAYPCSGGGNAGTGTLAAPTEFSKADMDAAVKVLLGNNADFFTPLIKAVAGQGTSPIRPAFWAIMHTDLIDALEAVSGFRSTSNYPAQSGVLDAEWGSTGNVRWLMSSVADRTLGTPDIYKCPVIGKHAYGIVDLEGGNAKSIIKAFGSGGTSDPLNQRATAGWKTAFVARILNDNFMLVLYASNLAYS